MQYIVEYSDAWLESFQRIARMLRPGLADACRLHHVGSTSIPGMPAKDVIDVVIECPAGSMAEVIGALGKLGYEHQGDLGIRGREAFRIVPGAAGQSLPTHHLYACEQSAFELGKNLAFRDFLNTHHDRMMWLAEQKRLADQGAHTRSEYIQNKDQAYAMITAESLVWAAGTSPSIRS